jgi:hypothetical protein
MARITNFLGIHNKERGKFVALCAAPREHWSAL